MVSAISQHGILYDSNGVLIDRDSTIGNDSLSLTASQRKCLTDVLLQKKVDDEQFLKRTVFETLVQIAGVRQAFKVLFYLSSFLLLLLAIIITIIFPFFLLPLAQFFPLLYLIIYSSFSIWKNAILIHFLVEMISISELILFDLFFNLLFFRSFIYIVLIFCQFQRF